MFYIEIQSYFCENSKKYYFSIFSWINPQDNFSKEFHDTVVIIFFFPKIKTTDEDSSSNMLF